MKFYSADYMQLAGLSEEESVPGYTGPERQYSQVWRFLRYMIIQDEHIKALDSLECRIKHPAVAAICDAAETWSTPERIPDRKTGLK